MDKKMRGQVRKPAPVTGTDVMEGLKTYVSDVTSGKYLEAGLKPLADLNAQNKAKLEAHMRGEKVGPASTPSEDSIAQAMDIVTPMSKVSGLAGILAGPNAIQKLPWDHPKRVAYDTALEMRWDGVEPDIINKAFKKSGVKVTPDGNLKWEIDDSAASWKYDPQFLTPKGEAPAGMTPSYKVGDVLDHEELYAAYPEFRNYDLVVVRNKPGETQKGSFSPSQKRVTLDISEGDPIGELSTMIHEMQHAVQTVEAFSNGANLSVVKNRLDAMGYSAERDDLWRLYALNHGEVEARAVQHKFRMQVDPEYAAKYTERAEAAERVAGRIEGEQPKRAARVRKRAEGLKEGEFLHDPESLKAALDDVPEHVWQEEFGEGTAQKIMDLRQSLSSK